MLCRPVGGLNDMFNQIYKCIQYCLKYDRILLVDTKYNTTFNNSFHNYFTIINFKDCIYNTNEINNIITNTQLSVYPKECQNLLSYRTFYSAKHRGLVVIDTDICLRIDININYDEDIIVHNTDGGGKLSQLFITKYFKINNFILDEYYKRYNICKLNDKPYISIHIRNTDYKLDYKKFFEDHKLAINNNNIFLATDSIDAKKYFCDNITSNLFNFTTFYDINKPLHKCPTDIQIIDMICDLLLLASGDNFILPDKLYGYTNLAYFLFENKNILHNIIS